MLKNYDWEKIKVTNDINSLDATQFYISKSQISGDDFIKSKKFAGVISEEELYEMVKSKLSKFMPIIVGVTGSIGKTVTKNAIGTVISQKYSVYVSDTLENTKYELAVDIVNNLTSNHKVLVIELNSKIQTEISRICSLFSPDVCVVTGVDESVSKDITSGVIFSFTKSSGVCILNWDSEPLRKLVDKGSIKKIRYSAIEKSDVYSTDIMCDVLGTSYVLNISYLGISSGRIKVSSTLLGEQSVYTSLVAASVAGVLGLSLVDIKKGILNLASYKGRLNVIRGVNGSTLIDDTYSSNEASCMYALDVLKLIKAKRKIAILGDIQNTSNSNSYRALGKKASENSIDILVCVGSNTQLIADEFVVSNLAFGIKPKVILYESINDCASAIINDIMPKFDDAILIKGSKDMKMENVTRVLLLNKDLESALVKRS